MGVPKDPPVCTPTDKSEDEHERMPFCVKIVGKKPMAEGAKDDGTGKMAMMTTVRGFSNALSMECRDGIELNGVKVNRCVHACT